MGKKLSFTDRVDEYEERIRLVKSGLEILKTSLKDAAKELQESIEELEVSVSIFDDEATRIIDMEDALHSVADWRKLQHEDDIDEGEEPRRFVDEAEWNSIETLARDVLGDQYGKEE